MEPKQQECGVQPVVSISDPGLQIVPKYAAGADPPKKRPEFKSVDTSVSVRVTQRRFSFGSSRVEVCYPMDEFLKLVLEHPSEKELLDPITRRPYREPLQVVESRAREALDMVAWKQAVFLSLTDRIDAQDAAVKLGGEGAELELLEMDREDMVRRANDVFDESVVAKQLADDYEESYKEMRLNRKQRLERALELKADPLVHGWAPSSELLGEIKAEIRDMDFGVLPSDWFRVQHLFAEQTGRLLFSPRQFSMGGRQLGEDRWHKGPVKGTVDEIVSMLDVYVDGAASVKRGLDTAFRTPPHSF